MSEKENPAEGNSARLLNVQRSAKQFELHINKSHATEDYAVEYVAKRYALSKSVARLVVGLAKLGRLA